MSTSDENKNELYERVQNALNNIRPFLQSDGGDIELIGITAEGVAQVKLLGNCDGCKMSASTMKAGVESTIKNFVPEIIAVEAI
ncbi:MAG TPA: NifU family protein [Chitinophagales bacterium]|nr:NifU family protein [Chitinophagales bacterium]HNM32361.1 NifU family protein [Chitinophagales bacterium]